MTTFSPIRSDAVIFDGGLDYVHPHIDLAPGCLIGCKNVEQVTGIKGYWRVGGMERIDGHRLQSDANFTKFTVSGNSPTAAVSGDTFTGVTSGASCVALSDYVGSGTTLYVYIFSGTPVLTETFNGAHDSFTLVSSTTPAVQSEDDETYTPAARTAARGVITAVPGSGSILGVARFNDVDLAFRNNVAGTAADMYKSSSSGWVKVDLGYIIEFDQATGEFKVGETITTGSVVGTITAAILQSGTWTGGTTSDTGYIVVDDIGTTITSGSVFTSSGAGSATATADSYAITITKDGAYKFREYNFYGGISTKRLYGCDGVNRAFEWDGTNYIPILVNNLDASLDKPSSIETFQFRLFLGYSAGSLQYSTVSDPTVFEVLTGGGYYDTGQPVMDIKDITNNTLAVFCDSSIWFLSGASKTTWVFSRYTDDLGCKSSSVQGASNLIFMYKNYIVSMAATQKFGDFSTSTLSKDVEPLIKTESDLFTCSVRNLKKSQYRMFFSNGNGITLTMQNGKVMGFTKFQYPVTISCVYSDDDNDITIAGATNGFVYYLDSGNSFDGAEIEGYLRFPYHSFKTPRNVKQFIKILVQSSFPLLLGDFTEIKHSMSFGYGGTLYQRGLESEDTIYGGGAFWDDDSMWGSFLWDSQIVNEFEDDVEGMGENMSLTLSFSSSHDDAFMFYSCIYDYILLGRRP